MGDQEPAEELAGVALRRVSDEDRARLLQREAVSREARLRSLLDRYVEHHVLQGSRIDPVELWRGEPELLAPLLGRIEADERAERVLQAETAVALAAGQVLGSATRCDGYWSVAG